jgi:hypothetical protein
MCFFPKTFEFSKTPTFGFKLLQVSGTNILTIAIGTPVKVLVFIIIAIRYFQFGFLSEKTGTNIIIHFIHNNSS